MDIRRLNKGERVEGVFEVMRELRPHFTNETLAQQIAVQQEAGYHVVYAVENDDVLGVAGFVVSEKLAWGKHVYIDDLVTTETSRSSGVGHALLTWIKDYAVQLGCRQLHLDSGVQRFGAHRFYLREGFDISSHHFQITELK